MNEWIRQIKHVSVVFKSSQQAGIECLLFAMPYARSWEYNREIQSCKQEMYNLVLKSQWEPLVILKSQKGVMDKAHILNSHTEVQIHSLIFIWSWTKCLTS